MGAMSPHFTCGIFEKRKFDKFDLKLELDGLGSPEDLLPTKVTRIVAKHNSTL